jgi:hypothetical protein
MVRFVEIDDNLVTQAGEIGSAMNDDYPPADFGPGGNYGGNFDGYSDGFGNPSYQ